VSGPKLCPPGCMEYCAELGVLYTSTKLPGGEIMELIAFISFDLTTAFNYIASLWAIHGVVITGAIQSIIGSAIGEFAWRYYCHNSNQKNC